MKFAAAALALSALVFATSSCDKHEWEKTKVLHEGSSGGHGGHGDAHGSDTGHGKPAAEAHEKHGEVHTAKPADGHAPAEKKH
jgi:hypothetical protein